MLSSHHLSSPAYCDAARIELPARSNAVGASQGHLTDYAATYYTYQWSLAIAKDLLSEFTSANGRLSGRAVGERYRTTVLAPGGKLDADILLRDFLGMNFPLSLTSLASERAAVSLDLPSRVLGGQAGRGASSRTELSWTLSRRPRMRRSSSGSVPVVACGCHHSAMAAHVAAC
jgi:hypothetical protein